MSFDPTTYEETSFDAILPAKELIKQIKQSYNNNKYPLVVDIGCGPGNTVKLLDNELKPEQIIGIDIDTEMISFAKQNNGLKNSEYYVQDIGADFDKWDQSLQKVSGKVSVIFSNYALHWVRDVETAAKNMSRLLSNTGIIVVDILYVGDIYRNVSVEQRAKYEQWLRYPSEQEVIGRWMSALKGAGLTQIDIKFWRPKCIYPEKVYDEFIQYPINWYKQYLKDNVDSGVNVDDLLKDLILKDRARKMSEKSPKGEDLIEIKQELWNFVIRK
ncbi:unnamed protein product [Oppiella nova]|uniref:Methyltransferase domain-containing protein n=1 Tax=Oppiella nova TaxID=334625 RepID=A0A7R9MIJ2_9ACAR|nr:unnamed protein product [Oppiella nova]CAG2177613.1 unnamed protein product [Oppiella nova]